MLTSLAFVVFGSMIVEARLAAHHERAQFARGGVEPPGDVYRLMRVVYPAVFAVMIGEGAWRGASPPALVWAGAALFVAAKALKWSAIRALGPCWTFRVVVVPDAPLVVSGPYRYLRHPNYVAVVFELLGTALMAAAVVSGPVALFVFGALLKKRMTVEERALAEAGPARPARV
ncbi:MAG: isoprenylcysteine carboxylmethyltransferase family protein [Vicinamibacterales bacterium]